MSANELREALDTLGWSHVVAARELGVSSRGRIHDWISGRRSIPRYIAVSVRTRLELEACRAAVPDRRLAG